MVILCEFTGNRNLTSDDIIMTYTMSWIRDYYFDPMQEARLTRVWEKTQTHVDV